MIVVRLPSMLQEPGRPAELTLDLRLRTIADVVAELDARYPGLAREIEDSIFNFAVNDEFVLSQARERALQSGDIVEIIPMISGG